VTGLQAINAVNGWAMAFVGFIIVLSGLAVLATIISQLHKIINWLERPEKTGSTATEAASDTQRALAIPERMPDDIDAVACLYKALAEGIDPPFELARLYALGAEHRLPHVHLSLRTLRHAGHLVPDGDGHFTWKP